MELPLLAVGVHFWYLIKVLSYPLWRMSAVKRYIFSPVFFFFFFPKIWSDLPASETAWNCFSGFKSDLRRESLLNVMNTVSLKWGVLLEHSCSDRSNIWKAQELICRVCVVILLRFMAVLVCPANTEFSSFILFFLRRKKEAMRKVFWGLLLCLSSPPWNEKPIILEGSLIFS